MAWHHRVMTATEKKQQAARDRLTELSTAYTDAEKAFDDAREALSAEIVSVLKARILGPSEVTRLVPFERQHVGRIAKAGGVPPLREPTVVSAKQSTAAPRPNPTAPVPNERPSPLADHRANVIAALTDQQAADLAVAAFPKADRDQYRALEAASTNGDRAVVAAALDLGVLTETELLIA
jgi:hypothetical protein